MGDMGTFRTTILIESAEHRGDIQYFVVFAEPGDMTILGARSLEGLNVRVDSQRKQLVPAGPILAGTAS